MPQGQYRLTDIAPEPAPVVQSTVMGRFRLADIQRLSVPEDDRSLVARAYDAAFTPPAIVARGAQRLADRINPPLTIAEAEAMNARPRIFGIPIGSPRAARSYAAGLVEGVSNLLTPGDAALTAATFGQGAATRLGLTKAAQALETLQRLAGGTMAVRGGERAISAESIPEAAAGVGEAALGLVGARHVPAARPAPRPQVRGELPAGARFVATPSGQVATAGTAIPMTQTPDGSFVRGVPAEYARREVAGLLPPGRTAIITPPPTGAVPEPHVTSQPAAVVEREIDPTKPAREAVTVRQYSGDPTAVDAPLLSDDELRMLRVMREDLETFTPQRGRLVRDVTDEGSSVFAHGGPGSPVGDDIRVISGQRVGNAQIAKAIDDLLESKAPSNRLHTAAIDAAKGYLEGRSGYRGPTLPMEAADEGGLAAIAQREAAAGGTGPAAVEDFDRFARIFDEFDGRPTGEPGEAGFIVPELAARVAGGAVGGALGASGGDEDESALRRAARIGLGAVAGAAAPSLLRSRNPRVIAQQLRREGLEPHTPSWTRRWQEVTSATSGPLPVSRSSRQGEPIPDPLARFEPFVAKFSNPILRQGVAQVIADNAGFADQRRGVIHNKALGQFANEVAINVENTLPKGIALNAEQITSYARALQATTRKVDELAVKVNGAAATDADLLTLQAARAEQEVIAKSLVGARTEAGRALGAFNFYSSILDTGDVRLIRDALKAPGLREDAQKIAQGLAALPDDPMTRYRWLLRHGTPSLMDKVRSYYYANILSGVKTHERNVLGNVTNAVSNLAVHPLAAGIDALKSAARGTPRTIRLDELPSQLVGTVAGFERGIRDFAFTMRHGVSPDALTRSVKAGEVGKLDVPRVDFKGGALNPFNIPGRLLDAADTLFRSVARNQELYGLAHTQAKREGLTGQRFIDRVAELRSGVTPDAVALRQQADIYATRAVFQETPGAFSGGLQSITRRYPALSFVMPFIKTPANILRQGLEFSPAGVLMKAARQEGRAGTQAHARAAAGTAAAGVLAYLAATGRISGDGPREPAKRAALMESGWRPNSLKVGDQWVSYQLFQPVSVQAALIANAFEAWAETAAKPEDASNVIASTLAHSANSFLDQSFMSGLFDVVEALKDPEYSGPRAAARVASGLIPLTGAVRTVQQARDPVVRRPEGVVESIKAGVPGLSGSVEPRIDRFGEVVTREGGPLRRAADPFNVASEKNDPIAKELDRLGVMLSLPGDRINKLPDGVTLTRQEDTALRQARGRAVRRRLEKLMASNGYQRVPDRARVKWIERGIRQAREAETVVARKRAIAMRRATGSAH